MLLVLLWCLFCSGSVFEKYSASFGGLSARENCGCDGLTGCGLFRAPSLLLEVINMGNMFDSGYYWICLTLSVPLLFVIFSCILDWSDKK